MPKIAVIGGNGRVGRALVARLARRPDLAIVSLGRQEPQPGLGANVAFVNTTHVDLADALADATHIVNCVSLKLNEAIYRGHSDRLERVVLVGSTRTFTAFDDPHAEWLREEERIFARSGLPGVLLQPSLIYAGGDKNISRLAYFLMKTPVVPLPNGGRSLIQPVHYEDVVASIEAALFAPNAPGDPIVVAGPRPITIRQMIETVAQSLGRKVRVVPVPPAILYAAAAATRRLPRVPSITRFQVSRMLEDRAFDISAMLERLNVTPRAFAYDGSDAPYRAG